MFSDLFLVIIYGTVTSKYRYLEFDYELKTSFTFYISAVRAYIETVTGDMQISTPPRDSLIK